MIVACEMKLFISISHMVISQPTGIQCVACLALLFVCKITASHIGNLQGKVLFYLHVEMWEQETLGKSQDFEW